MLLDEFLNQLDTKKAITSASSFYDLPWRNESGSVYLKLVKGALTGVPVVFAEDCVVSKDALHVLNIYRGFSNPATTKELAAVLNGLGWKADEYDKFHLGMYCTSLAMMGLMAAKAPDPEVISPKDSKVVFVPVFSGDDAEDRFVVIRENLKCYEVSEVKGKVPRSQAYIGLSVNEGRQASRGEPEAAENYAW
jgi:hypothetical protein